MFVCVSLLEKLLNLNSPVCSCGLECEGVTLLATPAQSSRAHLRLSLRRGAIWLVCRYGQPLVNCSYRLLTPFSDFAPNEDRWLTCLWGRCSLWLVKGDSHIACRAHAVPLTCCAINSHMPYRAPALLRQWRVLRESPGGSRKYPNC